MLRNAGTGDRPVKLPPFSSSRSGRNDSAEAPNRQAITPGAGNRVRTDDLLITLRCFRLSNVSDRSASQTPILTLRTGGL
jgi:hypothetical protein